MNAKKVFFSGSIFIFIIGIACLLLNGSPQNPCDETCHRYVEYMADKAAKQNPAIDRDEFTKRCEFVLVRTNFELGCDHLIAELF